ncbi:conserved hypothetical protein [Culex quinquefasciatus]|uniref:Uncharacterized protein n=1 Tax=Culex quinquefasciatus TaxID=7176 RepID=B0W2V7_CULQU|nr:conserved hypothetical protein [Culex quinquefasciatus]|eukprot:XP_001843041.1 conserved hypothetical protein [Culex quinquefasciatus]
MYSQMMEYQQAYGMGAYQQEMYYHQQQQHQQQSHRQPMQYTPEQAMYLNSVQQYQHFQATTMPMQSTNALDYQMTPALYVLNQQAKFWKISLQDDRPAGSKPKVRKQRGPYRKKNAKSPSPSPSAQSDSSACSTEELTGPTERGLKRKISTSEDGQNHFHQVNKQFKPNGHHSLQSSPAPLKASIFRSIDLLAQSSTNGRHC